MKGRLVCILLTLTTSSSINIYIDKQKMGVILAHSIRAQLLIYQCLIIQLWRQRYKPLKTDLKQPTKKEATQASAYTNHITWRWITITSRRKKKRHKEEREKSKKGGKEGGRIEKGTLFLDPLLRRKLQTTSFVGHYEQCPIPNKHYKTCKIFYKSVTHTQQKQDIEPNSEWVKSMRFYK